MEQPENAKPKVAAKIYVSQTSRPIHPFSAFGHQTQADAEQYGKRNLAFPSVVIHLKKRNKRFRWRCAFMKVVSGSP